MTFTPTARIPRGVFTLRLAWKKDESLLDLAGSRKEQGPAVHPCPVQ